MKTLGDSARSLLSFAGLVICATGAATDGIQMFNGEWKVYSDDDGIDQPQPFANAVLPADGGLWTLLPDVTKTTINTTDATIGGVDFGDRRAKFVSGTRTCDQSTTISGAKTLTFAGENAFIDGSMCGPLGVAYGSVLLGHYLFDTFSNPVAVPEGTTLTLKGASSKRFANLSGEGKIIVDEGALVFQKSDDGALHGGPVEIGHGNLDWKPSLAAGASAQVTLPSVSVSMPGTVLTVDPASGASAELTLGSLSLGSAGSLILDGICGSAPGIGHRAKVRVTDASSLPIHDGVLDANVMGLDDSTKDNGTRFHFLRYDETDGFKEFVPSNSLAEAGAHDIALVGEDVTLEKSTQVKGLLIDENERYNRENLGAKAPTLTIPENVLLKIGDDTNPAAIVINTSTGYTKQTTSALTGAGTIDFGSSEGFVYHGGSQENTTLDLDVKMSGSNGMNFLGTHTCVQFNLNTSAGWTGPTRIASGARFHVAKGCALPPKGDVYVEDTGRGYSSQLILLSPASWDQTFHLSGFGYGNDHNHLGALSLNNGDHAFYGGIVLERDAGICFSGSCSFMGPVSGPGKLVFGTGAGSEALFTGKNTATGGFLLSTGTVSFDQQATPGTGKVETLPDTLIAFRHDTGRKTVLPNVFDVQGALACRKADVSFTGPVSATEFRLDRTDVYVKDARVGSLVVHAASPLGAVDANSTLTIDAAKDSATAVRLVDGAGKLSFVKDGKATLTLTRPQSYGGSTTVKAGTLKLAGGLFSGADIAFWLDETSLVTDGDGVVAEWKSKVGDQTFTVKAAYGGESFVGPMATNTINGRCVATFSNRRYTALATPLTGPRATVRSCFVVYRASDELVDYCGLVGRYRTASGNDCGLRKSGDSWSDGSSFIDKNKYRQNGEGDLAIVPGRTTVLYLRLGEEGGKSCALAADSYASSWYMLGLRYYNHGTFDGDIAECIAFDRELTDDEAKYVENYLAKKWGVSDELYANIPEPEARVLPTSTALSVDEYATLDLNGTSATVASLAGRGTIVNTSATPATLTVSGASSFEGHVEGNVVVSVAGNLAVGVGAGATVQATGTTTITPFAATLVPTNGLALWCDASDTKSTPTKDGRSGRLNGIWASKAGRVRGLESDSGVNDLPYCDLGSGGWYDVQLINSKSRLRTTEPVSLRTVYICAQDTYEDVSKRGGDMILGVYDSKRGVRFDSSGTALETLNLDRAKSIAWNGNPASNIATAGERFVFAYRNMSVAQTPLAGSSDGTVLGTQKLMVGFGASGLWSYPCICFEVIMYDRDVTDEEDAQIRAYLTEKWISQFKASGQKQPYFRPAPVAFDPQASLLLADGASVDLRNAGSVALASLGGAGTVTGDVTLNGPFVVDARGGRDVELTTIVGNLILGGGTTAVAENCGRLAVGSWPVLTVTGSVTGNFTEMTVPGVPAGKVEWHAGENEWRLLRYGGTAIILR